MFTRLIIAIGRRYVQYINATYRRTGTLWDSRYKSLLIQAETYLLGCQRYIEFNPVRAAMVDHPAHYRWTVIVTTPLGNPTLIDTAFAISGGRAKRHGKAGCLP